jgi:hypothetical protein
MQMLVFPAFAAYKKPEKNAICISIPLFLAHLPIATKLLDSFFVISGVIFIYITLDNGHVYVVYLHK